ncbi:MAG TPA: tetratricopeptide repeat protein, partial [Flavisolibacter sp.]
EKLMIPFKVETDYVAHQIASFQNELRTNRGFYWLPWMQAAQWCLQRNVNLDQALQWADSAAGPSFGGNTQFATKAVKAQILEKLGRSDEAMAVLREAMPLANMNELHGYARSLLAQKKTKEAMEIFHANYKKNPAQFTTLVGLARGYSATGDYKNALKYAEQALPKAPDALNKTSIASMIEKLKKGQDVN